MPHPMALFPMLTSPNGKGLITIGGDFGPHPGFDGFFELKCEDEILDNCSWLESPLNMTKIVDEDKEYDWRSAHNQGRSNHIAFWIPEDFVENDFFELARGVAGDLVERMELTDEFTNPKTGKTSKCFRITYRSMDRSLTDEEINDLQNKLREDVLELGVEVR